jgi:CheY-specific phosphatase CheX
VVPPDVLGASARGLDAAARSLAGLVGHAVAVEGPHVGPPPLPAPGGMAVAFGLVGDGPHGSLVLLTDDARGVAALLGAPEHLTAPAVAEVGNVLCAHFLTHLGGHLGPSASITTPVCSADPVEVAGWLSGEPVVVHGLLVEPVPLRLAWALRR